MDTPTKLIVKKRRTFPQSGKQIAIIPFNYPDRWLNDEEAKFCVDELIERASNEADEMSRPPQFVKCKSKNGGILVAGATDFDNLWLEGIVANMTVMNLGKVQLVTADAMKLEYRYVVEGKICLTRLYSYEILPRIKEQNPRIRTETWKFIQESVTKTGHRSIQFEIDEKSVDFLRRKGNRVSLDACGLSAVEFFSFRKIDKGAHPAIFND